MRDTDAKAVAQNCCNCFVCCSLRVFEISSDADCSSDTVVGFALGVLRMSVVVSRPFATLAGAKAALIEGLVRRRWGDEDLTGFADFNSLRSQNHACWCMQTGAGFNKGDWLKE